MQTNPFTTACNKSISATHEIQKNGREEKKSWNRDTPKDKHNSSHTNATWHAY